MNVTNPATGKVIAEVPEDTPQTIAAKFEAARAAQEGWAGVPLEERIARVRRFRQIGRASCRERVSSVV